MTTRLASRKCVLLPLSWLVLLLCLWVISFFATAPHLIYWEGDPSPPPWIRAWTWLMEHGALIISLVGIIAAVLTLAATAASRGIGLLGGAVLFVTAFVLATCLSRWIAVSADLRVATIDWGFVQIYLVLLGFWLGGTTIVHGFALMGEERRQQRKAQSDSLADRRAEMLRDWGTDRVQW